MDLFNKIVENKGPIGMYASVSHGYFTFPSLEGEISTRMKFRGKEKIVWSLNNYLGLANHPEVRKADAEGAAEHGLGKPMGARMMSGDTKYHRQLERELGDFVGKDDTFLLNYGYQGVLSIIDALLDRHDILVYDAQSHACIVDGARLHQGKRFAYKHNEIDDLEKQLIRAEKLIGDKGGILVVTEGVFGMSGDQGKLKEIVALKEKHEFRVFIDDAHGFGVMGPRGEGTHIEQGVEEEIDIYFSTFAKSMASIGAFVSSNNKEIINHLRYNMRSQIFAKSLPLPLVIGDLKRLELIRNSTEFRDDLWKVVNRLQAGLKERGFDIGATNSCVTPVYLKGGVPEAANLIADLRENYDIFCSLVVYPVIPKGEIIIRMVSNAGHSEEDIDITLNAFAEVAKKLKNKEYDTEKVNLPE
ncbi:MAG: pyridoxal phosphate-dependent aminotransferase family protein [Bacteroidota bacterium]|nr:pyridoxal phosphate-dependent aminotransferase family protein [Bacteroidota bacterium]